MADLVKSTNPESDKIQMLASFGCSIIEIAKYFQMDESTVRKKYREALETGRESLKVKLRQLQWDHAARGNTALLIWLGKQYLGQTDKQEVDHNHQMKDLLKEVGYEDNPRLEQGEQALIEKGIEQEETVEEAGL